MCGYYMKRIFCGLRVKIITIILEIEILQEKIKIWHYVANFWIKLIRIQVKNISLFTEFLNRRRILRLFYSFFRLFLSLNLITFLKITKFLLISLFSTVPIWVWEKKIFFCFLLIFWPDPWIRIHVSVYFCGSGSRTPKCCGSNGSGFYLLINIL